jgi:hypothetical protein
MALALVPGRAAQGDAVIQRAFVLDHRRLADHHAHAVVDEHAAADRRSRMDLDAGNPAREMGQRTRQPAHAMHPTASGKPCAR